MFIITIVFIWEEISCVAAESATVSVVVFSSIVANIDFLHFGLSLEE
jgi:hypothetical protein